MVHSRKKNPWRYTLLINRLLDVISMYFVYKRTNKNRLTY